MDPVFDIVAALFLLVVVIVAARYVKGRSDERHAWWTIGLGFAAVSWLLFRIYS